MAKNSNIRVIDASSRTEFENSAYFTRKFKKITPMKYLKKQRESV